MPASKELIQTKIIELLREETGEDVGEASTFEGLDMDSLDMEDLVLDLTATPELDINPDIDPAGVNTVGELAAKLASAPDAAPLEVEE